MVHVLVLSKNFIGTLKECQGSQGIEQALILYICSIIVQLGLFLDVCTSATKLKPYPCACIYQGSFCRKSFDYFLFLDKEIVYHRPLQSLVDC